MRASWRILLGVVILGAVGLAATFTVVQFGTGEVEATNRSSASAAAPESVPTTSAVTAPAITSTTAVPTTTTPPAELLPPDSGEGRRVVLSVGGQRTWWVGDDGVVLRTSLVSGRENTPSLGTFQVYSRTENATGLDGSKMDYFVRFTKGPNGWAIGFHDIPEMNGVPVQTDAELGQPLSHGCIRQSQADALFTWAFLQVGSTVVVVA